MRVLFAGTPAVACPTLQALIDSPEHEVVGVLTRADARKGRGRTLHPSPVAELARGAGLSVETPRTLREGSIQDWVREREADVAVVVAYGRLVPAELLDVPTHGWLNLHFSLLPAWRGAAPVQHALRAGDTQSGMSIFRLDEGLDTGDIYAQQPWPMTPTDTSGSLLEAMGDAGAPFVLTVLQQIAAGSVTPQPQAELLADPAHEATLAPMLTPADGVIDWSQPAEEIDRIIRSVTPAPGASTTFRGARLGLGPAELVPERSDLAPGHVEATKREVVVGTGTCVLRLGQVAPAGKKHMNAADWARGARPAAGESLGAAPADAPHAGAQAADEKGQA